MNSIYLLFEIIAVARFVVVSDQDVNASSKQQENENTKNIMLCNIKIFEKFLESCDGTREIESI